MTLHPDIVLIHDPRWHDCLEELRRCERFAYDVETYDPRPWSELEAINKRRKKWITHALDPFRGRLRLIQVGLPSGRTLIYDVGGRDISPRTPDQVTHDMSATQFFETLRTALANPKQEVIGVNLKFDQVFSLVHLGSQFKLRRVRDLELLSRVLWAGVGTKGTGERMAHSLQAIAARFNLTVSKTEQTSDWGGTLTIDQYNYAYHDVQVVFALEAQLHHQLIESDLTLPAWIECQASPVFAEMEYRGMAVNLELLNQTIDQYQQAQQQVREQFQAEFPEVNPTKVVHSLLPALKQRYEIQSTADELLATIADKPGIAELRLWRSVTKPLESLVSLSQSLLEDQRARSRYMQMAPQGTGRSSSRANNLQNTANLTPALRQLGLPSVRSVFTTPKNRQLIVSDLSQAHARIAAEFSQDAVQIQAYTQAIDLHCLTAATLAKTQGLDWNEADIAQWRADKTHPNHDKAQYLRSVAKTVNYSSLNQVGGQRLHDQLQEDGLPSSVKSAKQAIAAWRSTYKELYQFICQQHQKSNQTTTSFVQYNVEGEYGVVRGLSGRRSYFRQWPNPYQQNRPQTSLTDVTSFLWLSTEADVIKLALSQIQAQFDQHPYWQAWVCNMVHDEIDVECDIDCAQEVAACVQAQMNQAMETWLKLVPGYEDSTSPSDCIVSNWAEK